MNRINTFPLKNSAIIRMYSEREMVEVNPIYQRKGGIWSLEKKQLLIDSIINDFDIPKIYFRYYKTLKTIDQREILYSIIDGRQRMEAIWEFIDNKFPLSEDFDYFKDPKIHLGNLLYKDIAKKYPKVKIELDSFTLPIVLVEAEGIDLIEDMFLRLNEAVPLNAAEKRNAIGGPMARMIHEITEHTFFTDKIKFPNTRYQHKEMSAKLLFLQDTIVRAKKVIDTKKVYLDNFVKLYKLDANMNPSKLGNDVKLVLNEMNNIFENKDVLLGAQSYVPIYFLLFRSAMEDGRLSNITREKIFEFKSKVKENRQVAEKNISKADFELLEFDRLSIQGTNDANSIKERLRIISKFFSIGNLKLE